MLRLKRFIVLGCLRVVFSQLLPLLLSLGQELLFLGQLLLDVLQLFLVVLRFLIEFFLVSLLLYLQFFLQVFELLRHLFSLQRHLFLARNEFALFSVRFAFLLRVLLLAVLATLRLLSVASFLVVIAFRRSRALGLFGDLLFGLLLRRTHLDLELLLSQLLQIGLEVREGLLLLRDLLLQG